MEFYKSGNVVVGVGVVAYSLRRAGFVYNLKVLFPARLIRGSITHVTIAKRVRGRVGGGSGGRDRPGRGCVEGVRAGRATSGRTGCALREGALSFSREPKALTIAE